VLLERPVSVVFIQLGIGDANGSQQEGKSHSTTYSGLVLELNYFLLYLGTILDSSRAWVIIMGFICICLFGMRICWVRLKEDKEGCFQRLLFNLTFCLIVIVMLLDTLSSVDEIRASIYCI